MAATGDSDLARAMALLPSGMYLLSAAHEGKRAGTLVRWVQPCCPDPPLITVATRKGQGVEPLIRESHAFSVCRVDPEDRLIGWKFGSNRPPDESGDPFDAIPTELLATGSPVVMRSMFALDCAIVRHLDLEADHGLYIGHVLAARVYDRGLVEAARAGTNGTARAPGAAAGLGA